MHHFWRFVSLCLVHLCTLSTAFSAVYELRYEHFFVRPQVPNGVNYVKISKNTPYGKIQSEWKTDGDSFTLQLTIPFGSRATVQLPSSSRKYELGSGTHTLSTKIN